SEVAFVLSKRAGFRLPGEQVARLLASLVRARGLRISNRQIVLEAFQIWESRPSLGFVDALGAAYGRQENVQLATFDKEIPKVKDVAVWNFDAVTD
ncbi:MAG: PIN domain-containing protein, partial [Thermomicrobiales bacterium]